MLPKKVSFCSALPGFPLVFSYITDMMLYLLALLINLIVYVNVIITSTRRASHDLGARTQHKAQHERYQVARLLITNGVVFFLCFTTWQFTNLDRIVTYLTGSHLFLDISHWYLPIIGLFMGYVKLLNQPICIHDM